MPLKPSDLSADMAYRQAFDDAKNLPTSQEQQKAYMDMRLTYLWRAMWDYNHLIDSEDYHVREIVNAKPDAYFDKNMVTITKDLRNDVQKASGNCFGANEGETEALQTILKEKEILLARATELPQKIVDNLNRASLGHYKAHCSISENYQEIKGFITEKRKKTDDSYRRKCLEKASKKLKPQ